MPVAIRTSEGQIFGNSFARMLAGFDVIDLKAQRKGMLRRRQNSQRSPARSRTVRANS